MATTCRSPPDELSLLCVQLQPVAACPPRHVVDALRHIGLEHARATPTQVMSKPTRPKVTLPSQQVMVRVRVRLAWRGVDCKSSVLPRFLRQKNN